MAKLERIDLHRIYVSPKTTWLFLDLVDESGLRGVGEVTAQGQEAAVAEQMRKLGAALRELDNRARLRLLREPSFRSPDRLSEIVRSGFEQAVLDLEARSLGVGCEVLLGGGMRDGVRAYGNFNRGTLDRTASGWQARALKAVAAGHRALKMAPFDGVEPHLLAEPETRARIRHGIDVVHAVREAIGSEIMLNVDCHMRFTEAVAIEVVRELEPAGLFWLESPIQEAHEEQAAMLRVKSAANARGVRLAGAEDFYRFGGFRRFVENKSLDVILPDIRLCGGPLEAARLADYIGGAGIEYSLHNPAGPVLDAISLKTAHACTVMSMLEQQFKENAIYDKVTTGMPFDPIEGVRIVPDAPGWGVELVAAEMNAYPPPA